jgi:hypothetical protein
MIWRFSSLLADQLADLSPAPGRPRPLTTGIGHLKPAPYPQSKGFRQIGFCFFVLLSGTSRNEELSMIRASLLATALMLITAPVLAVESSGLPSPPIAPQPLVNSLGTIDLDRVLTLNGVVKFVQLGPLRSRVQVLVTLPGGQVQEWSLEGPSRQIMHRLGSRSRPVEQWDQVTFSINPLKDAAAAGEIRALATVNGVASTTP